MMNNRHLWCGVTSFSLFYIFFLSDFLEFYDFFFWIFYDFMIKTGKNRLLIRWFLLLPPEPLTRQSSLKLQHLLIFLLRLLIFL